MMTNEQSTRWMATLSLMTSTAALAASVAVASGCRGEAQTEAAPGGGAAEHVVAPPASETKARVAPAGTAQAEARPADRSVRSREPSGETRHEVTSTEKAAEADIKVKRLVVTRGVEDREPLPTESLTVGAPVFAFLELENEGDARGGIVITFEHDRESVGHVELSVPADAPRWRTWGRTAMIRSAGEWTAVVKTAEGRELARQAFEVTDA
jgi:hypothetical protein